MKNTFEIEIVSLGRFFNSNKINALRARLKPLLKLDGIISMCLEPDILYVEFNPNLFNLEMFKIAISDIGLPIEQNIKLASFHYVV